MNKAELIEVVAARIDASKKDAGEAVQAVIDAITEAVAKGQKVSISGFGVFERAARPARTYRTPSTGEAIQKLATTVPKFRPGGDVRDFVAGNKDIAEIARRAEEVVRRVTGQPTKSPDAAEAPAAKKAPAKKTAAKKTTAKKTSTARRTTAAAGTAAKKAQAKRTTARKTAAAAAELQVDAPASSEATPDASDTQ